MSTSRMPDARRSANRRCVATAVALGVVAAMATPQAAGLTISGPNLDPRLLRVTVFADGLNYPVGMAPLDDGSLLTAVSNGSNYFGSSTGSIIRLADTNGDGIAEQRQTLVNNVPGGKLSALRRAGQLVAVTGQGAGTPISLYRLGATASDPLSYLGGITLNYPSGDWLHPHSALAFRQDPVNSSRYELYFQLGSDANFSVTTRTVTLSGSFGVAGTLAGDSVHRIDLIDGPGGLAASAPTRIASGLRNATGMDFDPTTGDLYLGENGIDGVVDANEPTSADEIDVVAAAELGVTIPNFGFPSTYEAYRTGLTVGSSGQLPLVTFQPIPSPNGSESEGVNEIVFAPPLFPEPLSHGLFGGFHGRFNLAGTANEENPLMFVDLDDLSSFQFVPNSDASVGHLDGLAATKDTLYVADISSQGGFFGTAANSGKIYAIQSLIPAGDYDRDGDVDGGDWLRWQRELGGVQAAYVGADGDGDRSVEADDLAIWTDHFGAIGPAIQATPEPGSASLALLGLTLRRRNRTQRNL